MPRFSPLAAYAALMTASCSAFSAPRPTTPGLAGLFASTSVPYRYSDEAFASEGAKRQIGNDAFLNKELMARAQNGPGKVHEEKLNIGIVGAGLVGFDFSGP